MIRTEKLTRDYGSGRGVIDLDLNVPEGTIFGYIGPNGAGKTTTIKLLCGLIKPTRGRAFIDGLEIVPRNSRVIKRKIGYMPEVFGVYDQMSVWEYLDFFCAAYRIPRVERETCVQAALKLTDAACMLDYQVASLSYGMRQRIGLARILLHDPQVLILDEPAGGLDPSARIEIRKTIRRLRDAGKTILLSSHILPEVASICDLVGIIQEGRLLTQGSVREITEKLREHLVLVLQVDSGVAEAVELCLGFPNVEQTSASGNEIRLSFSGTRAQVADLNAMLVRRGVRVTCLKEEEADLEHVFLTVTGDNAAARASDLRQRAGASVVRTVR